ncbi:MAG: sigma-70 family RNA polymerase sigma factor [Planctomycetota bacterium]
MDAISLAKPCESTEKVAPTLRDLFEECEGPLLRYGSLLVGRREIAEEIVQEVFLALHGRWAEVESPRAWLFRSVRNAAFKHNRDNKRMVVGAETPEVEACDAGDGQRAFDRREAAAVLREFVEELPDDERRLVQLRYYKSLKYREIAELTGLTVGNVGYRLHHLLKGLAQRLREQGIDQLP